MRIGKTARKSAIYGALFALAVVVGVLFAVRGGFAETQLAGFEVATTADPPRPKLQGIAVRQNDQLLMRAEDGQELALVLGANESVGQVTRDKQHVTMNDIQDGDALNVALNHDGTVYRLDALTPSADHDTTTFQISSLRRSLPLVFSMVVLGLAAVVIVGAVRTGRRPA